STAGIRCGKGRDCAAPLGGWRISHRSTRMNTDRKSFPTGQPKQLTNEAVDLRIKVAGSPLEHRETCRSGHLRNFSSNGSTPGSQLVQILAVRLGQRESRQVLDFQFREHSPRPRFNRTEIPGHEGAVQESANAVEVKAILLLREHQEKIVACIAAVAVDGS